MVNSYAAVPGVGQNGKATAESDAEYRPGILFVTCAADPTMHRAASADPGRAVPLQRDLIIREAASFEVETVQETGSTSVDLVARARQAQPARPILRAALLQTAGRGRVGRRWHASAGGALLFSLAVPVQTAAERIAAATLVCGIAVAETLRGAGIAVTLKWPNDLLLDRRKLGGVLCELAVDGQERRTLVIGVGVNLHLDRATRDSIDQPAAALDEVLPAATAQREFLIGRLAMAIGTALRLFEEEGFVPLQPRFMALFAHRDAQVDLYELGVRVASGRALGVDGEGRLLLDTDAGLRACSGGEMTVRVAT
jgi:BirA family biotin operon repressor/biotin-[acetyl-CoA-carboxylase] ligase